jgi:hypothetical protein
MAALDYFDPGSGRLCGVDVWVRAGLGGGDATVYRAREQGRVVDEHAGSAADGALCVRLPPRDGYRVVELATRRPGERHFGHPVQVHLVERGGTARVVGLVR